MRDHPCSRLGAGRDFYLLLPQLEDPDGSGSGGGSGSRGMDPRIRIRFYTKMSWIRNTADWMLLLIESGSNTDPNPKPCATAARDFYLFLPQLEDPNGAEWILPVLFK